MSRTGNESIPLVYQNTQAEGTEHAFVALSLKQINILTRFVQL